jgi:hypothetical protein
MAGLVPAIHAFALGPGSPSSEPCAAAEAGDARLTPRGAPFGAQVVDGRPKAGHDGWGY